MKKTVILFIFLSLLLTACGVSASPGEPAAPSAAAITFTDDLGRVITVDQPQHIACLTASFADIWCLAGGADSIVAATNATWIYFDLALGENVVNLGSSKSISLEQLIACQPDLILASCGTDRNLELEHALEQANLTVAYFSVNTFEDYLRMLKTCTDITGKQENYELYGTDVAAAVSAALSRPDGSRPSVLYLRLTGTNCRVKGSEGTVLGEMLCALDCRNIADRDEKLLEQLSIEAILMEDPDYIFIIMQGSDTVQTQSILKNTLLSNPAWQQLTAVQEGRCHILDPSLFNMKPNARWGEAYEILADILYPET